MRTILLILAGIIVAAVSAYAQESTLGGDGRFQAEWETRPTGRDFARHFPIAAVERQVSGISVLCCSPREDRTLDCRVGLSWPSEYAFGEASLVIARRFRMTPESYQSFESTPGAWLQVPILWTWADSGPEFEQISQRVRELSRGLCRPQS